MDGNTLGAHDPFRALKDKIGSSVKPGNFGVNDKGDKSSNASNNLGAVEKAASSPLGETAEGVAGAKSAEESSDGFYSGTGKEITEDSKATGLKGFAKKGGPLYTLLFLIVTVGSFFLGGQALQPFSLVAEFQEVFNSMHISAEARSEKFFKFQMSKRTTKSPYNIFGTDFSISEKQQNELKKYGIEYDDEYDLDGKKTKVMKYVDTDGEEKIVTADNFKKVYMENPTFFEKYNAGSMTWRGAFANWFGTTTGKFLKNNKLTRDMWKEYKEAKEKVESGESSPKTDAEKREAEKKIVQDTIEEKVKGDGELDLRLVQEGEDEDGNTAPQKDEEGTAISRSVDSEADVKAKLEEISNKVGAGNRANSAASVACGILNLVGTVSLLVTANEALQIIQITTSLFEAVDKTKAGLGDESPISVFADALNERKKTTNVVIEDDGSSLEPVAVVRDRSAVESAGVSGLYSRGLVDPNDPSVSSFNISSNLKRIAGGVGVSATAFAGCTAAKMAGAVVSGIGDAAEIGACLLGVVAAIPTAGLSAAACGGLLANIGLQIVAGATLGAVLGTVTSVLVPAVSSALMRNLVKQFGGEDFGNAITLGANLYQGSAHRSNGGSLASMEKYEQFAVEQQRVIADNARYERETLSPFDISSKNTFMGSIMNKLMGYTSTNSVMSALTASSSVMSSSLSSITGTASAYDVSVDLPDSIEDYGETCPYLASIGAIGDSFCNPYVVTDVATMDKDPDEVLEKVREYGGFSNDSGDNVEIDPDSDLAKYIRYCDNRQSSFGIADQNIVGEVGNTVDTGSNAINGAIGAAPIIGDVLEFIDDSSQFDNMGYITGESCVAGNSVNYSESPKWSKAKYYQRFIEDQSLAESMGVIEESAVTAYLDDYYEKNPLDNSYEGILARYSGLEKDTVVAVLDIMEYENYIASYDPSDKYVFGEEEEHDEEIIFDQENVMDGAVVALGQIVYADVRNRYFVV